MPALAEFLKTTVSESLTKVLQPAGVIPGALLVLLNVAFVYPRANAAGVDPATAYHDLSEGWQVVTVATAILLVGYLLLSASAAVLDTLTGHTWRPALLAALSSYRRDRLRARLLTAASNVDVRDRSALRWQLYARFAPTQPDAAGGSQSSTPTALGDVFLAFDESIRRRYGVRLAPLWEPLRAVKSDAAAVKATDDQKTSLDLMSNLTFAGALFAFEAVVAFSLLGAPGAVLLTLLTVPFVYIAYRVTIAKACSWLDGVDTTVALYRDELLTELNTRKTGGFADQRTLFENLSTFMLGGEPAADLFETEEKTSPTVTASSGVDVQVRVVALDHRSEEAAQFQGERLDYVAVVTRKKGGSDEALPADLILQDARVPRIRADPASSGGATAQAVRATGRGAADLILWHVPLLRQCESRLIRFSLDRWHVAADQGLKVLVHRLAAELYVTVINDSAVQVTNGSVSVFFTEDGYSHRLILVDASGAAGQPTLVGRTHHLGLAPLPAGGSASLSYMLESFEELTA